MYVEILPLSKQHSVFPLSGYGWPLCLNVYPLCFGDYCSLDVKNSSDTDSTVISTS